LAFVNPEAAYVFQVLSCQLPSLPIWYRLGLALIPRYIIGCIIAGLATAVYLHVWIKFKSFTTTYDSNQLLSRASFGENYTNRTGEAKNSTVVLSNAAQSVEVEVNALSLMSTRERAAYTVAGTRQALQKQLRLIFIYPIVYLVIWIPPLCFSIMQYTDKDAHNSTIALPFIATLCATFIGLIDCSIFLWREKPWRFSLKDGRIVSSEDPVNL
jgi:G protein-coupled glucose receptor regulating Gpa2 C-term/G protein-coupled glucose receptor regulating Gpa2